MGLEKVKDRVLQEAKGKAATATNQANEEARKITSVASKKAKEAEKVFTEKLNEEVASVANRQKAAGKLEAKKLNLSFRKQFIDEILEQVKEKINNLPDATRAKHVKKLLDKAGKEITIATVYCNKKDRKHVGKHKVKDTDIIGGIIAESSNGTLRVDYSYETLLEQLQESLMPELNEMLFK